MSSIVAKFIAASAIALASLVQTGVSVQPATADVLRASPADGVFSGVQRPPTQEFRLRLRHAHTEESVDVAYRRGTNYLEDGIDTLNHFLRDYRTGEDAHYDPKEFDLLVALMQRLRQPGGVIEVLCGYRSPETNAYLRTRAAVTGVAENSMHILSKAIDIRVPGVSTERLRDAAISLQMGGVGYYPRSRFVHVDVGPVRQWSFGGSIARHVAHHRTRREDARQAF